MKMIYSLRIRSKCHFFLSLLREAGSDVKRERENKSRPEVRGERKPNIKHYFVLPHLSVPLQICNGTDTNGILLAHMQHLMGVVFCVWCGICAKYLAFVTYSTSTVGALIEEERGLWFKIQGVRAG